MSSASSGRLSYTITRDLTGLDTTYELLANLEAWLISRGERLVL